MSPHTQERRDCPIRAHCRHLRRLISDQVAHTQSFARLIIVFCLSVFIITINLLLFNLSLIIVVVQNTVIVVI